MAKNVLKTKWNISIILTPMDFVQSNQDQGLVCLEFLQACWSQSFRIMLDLDRTQEGNLADDSVGSKSNSKNKFQASCKVVIESFWYDQELVLI